MDKILIRSTPKITPTTISLPDSDTVKDKNGQPIYSPEQSEAGRASRKGSVTPIVQIGGTKIPESMIKSLTIWQEDLLPQLALTIIDTDSVFGAGSYPIADILISVFIRSQNEKLKSLSADYMITSVGSFPMPGTNVTVYTFAGELHVPKMNGQFSKAFKGLTSLEALKKVADELQLGFADNQPENTNDRMTWLMPNYSYKSLINHIKKMAYRDENNFFDCFVDRYYILNFINVEKMFSTEPETDKALMALEQTAVDRRKQSENGEPAASTVEVDLILNNNNGSKGTEFYIEDFSLMGHHGEVLMNNSIRKHIYWYDHGGNTDSTEGDEVNFIEHFLEPLQNKIGRDGLLPQTVNIKEFRDEADDRTSTGIWKGVDYSNAHPTYKFASMINEHNLLETKKNQLKVTLNGININVLRGSRIAVLIYLTQTAARSAENARKEPNKIGEKTDKTDDGSLEKETQPAGQLLDKALSGFYYVSSIKYSYNDGKFQTDMVLSRRHWLLPRPKNKIKL